MVLRFLAILILLMSFSTFAKSTRSILKKAKTFHAKKQYAKSNKVLRKYYNFKHPQKMPAALLFMAGLNYQKAGNYSSSVYFFNHLIRKAYRKYNRKVFIALKKDTVDDLNIPKILQATYYELGIGYYAQYKKKKSLSSLHKARRYFQICSAVDYKDSCEDFVEKTNEKINYEKKSVKNIEFFISAGTLVFQSSLNLKDDPNSTSHEILSNVSSLCYGAGIRYGNAFSGYEVSGCTFSGTATVQDDTNVISYKQAGIPVVGFLLEGGYYIKPVSDKTRLSLSLPLLYHAGSYTEPTGLEFEKKKDLNYGVMITAGWEVWFLEMQMKLGTLGKTNLFMLQSLINF